MYLSASGVGRLPRRRIAPIATTTARAATPSATIQRRRPPAEAAGPVDPAMMASIVDSGPDTGSGDAPGSGASAAGAGAGSTGAAPGLGWSSGCGFSIGRDWSSVMSPSSSPDGQAAERAASATPGELLHEALHLAELLDQAVDLGQRGARARCDPSPAGPVDDGGLAAFVPCHRPDDRLGPFELAAVDRVLGVLRDAAHARDHRHELPDRAHLLDLLQLLEEVLEGELGLAQLLLELLRLRRVDGLLGALDERQDVAHAQDPAGEAVGM